MARPIIMKDWYCSQGKARSTRHCFCLQRKLTREVLCFSCSALFKQGRRGEAAKHLRRAAAYDPRYSELLEQCEKENHNFIGDLANSRRGDY